MNRSGFRWTNGFISKNQRVKLPGVCGGDARGFEGCAEVCPEAPVRRANHDSREKAMQGLESLLRLN
jgi:hypothetical protein